VEWEVRGRYKKSHREQKARAKALDERRGVERLALFGHRVDLVEIGAVRNTYLRLSIEEEQETIYAPA
jgi:predicted nucleotidyltransferase